MCQEFCPQGGLPQCMRPPRPGTPQDQAPPGAGTPHAVYAGRYGQEAGGMHPTGMNLVRNHENSV